ncbi:MAG: fibronectin type III domain-containing protein [Methanomassiliicoccus sp.]|nr:fibronectin type III domain-containing protein [Methanomassiliicoccus sp.]
MISRKGHQVLAFILTFLVLAGCFFALAPSTIRAAAPGQPTDLSATAGNGQVTLSWNPPSEGGSSVDYYVVNQNSVELATHYTGTSATIAGLTNGQTYTFSVAAYNGSDIGSPSNEVTSTPVAPTPTLPGAPTGLTATPGDREVRLSWAAPSSDAGAAIDHYVVYQDAVALSNNPTATSVTISGLTNGQQYSFTVAANNSAGTGPQTSAVQATPNATSAAPGAPTGLQAAPGNGQITLTWSAPSNNGGSAITAYKVYRGTTAGGETLLATIGNVLTYTDSSVTNGVTYYYNVSAVNSVGEGSRSTEVSTAPTASSTVPSVPLTLASAAGNNQVTLSWAAPSSDGGAAIDYYVIYRDGADIAHITGTSTTVSGLTNGQQYSFTVAAHNSEGTGPQTAAVTVTPGSGFTVPGAPTDLTITPGDGQVTLSWKAPSNDGGAAIDYYIVYQNGVDVAHPTSTSAVISGLTNGQSYRFMLVAHNAAGTGAVTMSYVATPEAKASTEWLLIGAVVLTGAVGVIALFTMWRRREASPPHAPTSLRHNGRPPEAKAPGKQAPPASARVTTPLSEQLGATRQAEQSKLCPRCGRPNSGRTNCAFCGKKLK